MPIDEASVYQFGDFRLDVRERRLLREGRPIALPAKVLETLKILVDRPGRLLTKDELMRHLWPDTVVEENNLSHNISVLRQVLGERDGTGAPFIETVPRVGYRFLANVTQSGDGAAASVRPPAAPAASAQTLRQ